LVTRRTLEAHLAAEPSFAFELLAKVIRRARAATLSAKGMALNDVYGRLKHLLETTAEPQPDGTRRVAERLTHLELANRVGCSREMITRQLNDLQQGGYVGGGRGELVLLKPLPPRW
jgi:CRP/FNR family transcriptional regulator, cyclic AMP receptor protein